MPQEAQRGRIGTNLLILNLGTEKWSSSFGPFIPDKEPWYPT
jgi:hypothetical protein